MSASGPKFGNQLVCGRKGPRKLLKDPTVTKFRPKIRPEKALKPQLAASICGSGLET